MTRALSTLHVDTGREFRGGQRQVGFLLRGLAQRGHRVRLVVPPGAPLVARLEDAPGVEVVELAMRGELSIAAARRVGRMLRDESWDLLHTHTPHGISLAHFARRLGGRIPLVAHRRVDFPLKRNPGARLKKRWPDRWIAVSGGVRDQLVRDGIEASRIDVIHSALDPERTSALLSRDEIRAELGLAPGDVAIGTVGALADHKGQRTLIDAVATLGARTPAPRLFVVGIGELRDELEGRARERGIGSRVHFLGQREDVPDLLVGWDVFVFPSRSGEGSPAALKEALAAGVPTIASDLVAHAEIGVPEDDLFTAGDASTLRARLERVLRDPAAALARAAALRPLAARFHPDTLVDQTLAVYASVLQTERAGTG